MDDFGQGYNDDVYVPHEADAAPKTKKEDIR
jgi:hypothetical protein